MTTIDESDYRECRDLCEHLEDKRAELTQRVAEIEAQFEKFRSLYHAEIATSTRYADRVRELEMENAELVTQRDTLIDNFKRYAEEHGPQ